MISILLLTLFITNCIVIINQQDTRVQAAEVPHGNQENAIGLDLGFFQNTTVLIAHAVYNAYNGNQLRKGREFGSKGCENYSKNLIYNQMNNLSLNPQNITLMPIQDAAHALRFYTSFINVTNFNLHINYPGFCNETNLSRDIPTNESFVTPSIIQDYFSDDDLNHTFNLSANKNIVAYNDTYLTAQHSYWPMGGSITGQYKNVSCNPQNDGIICGNVTFMDQNKVLPTNQIGKVFLINETEGCESILNNITNATGVILIHNNSFGHTVSQNVIDNMSSAVERVSSTNSNLQNITARILNGETVLADNFVNNSIVTYTYGFNSSNVFV